MATRSLKLPFRQIAAAGSSTPAPWRNTRTTVMICASSLGQTRQIHAATRQQRRANEAQKRNFSLGSLSPSAMRIYALRLQAESASDDITKHTALFSALLEAGSKDNAKDLVQHYEKYADLNGQGKPQFLQDQKAFDLYLAALAIANEGNAVSKLAEASQIRNSLLSRPAELPTEAPAAAPAAQQESIPQRPVLTEAQLASAVLSRNNPNASVRVVNRDASSNPVEPALPTSASPAASNMTQQIQADPSTPDVSKPVEANPAAPASLGAAGAATSTTSSGGSSSSSSSAPPNQSAPAPSAKPSTGASSAAASSNEPIRVVVEEARGNLAIRALAWLGRTLFLTFLTLTLLSFMIDQSGIMRGASGRGGPSEFQPPTAGKTYKFSDVHGCEEAKSELEEVVEFLKDPKKFSALGGKLPRGVLLTGPPGTGKTLLARAVAGEAGVKFLFASGSEFDEMYVGVGARRMRELFQSAKANAPAIIFIDELDAVGGKRSPKNMQYSQQTLNELLVQLDGFTQTEGVILIGATNFPESLDKALVRPGRFDRHIVVPLPDVRGRLAILKHHMQDVQYDSAVDVSVLARGTPGFSGAELQNLVNQAAVHAARAGKSAVVGKDFEWAKNRVMMGAERKSAVITPEDKKLTAFHEAGHALVALMTEGSTPLHSVTCLPRGASLGLTSFLPEMDITNHTYTQLIARLDVAFGGRAAEEIIFGKSNITTGASSDISQATRIANSMVRQYGYSDVVGPVSAADSEELSPSTRSMIDSEVRRMLEEAKQRAFDVLTTNKHKLETLANALIEYETLDKSEVLKILAGEKIEKEVP